MAPYSQSLLAKECADGVRAVRSLDDITFGFLLTSTMTTAIVNGVILPSILAVYSIVAIMQVARESTSTTAEPPTDTAPGGQPSMQREGS